MRTTFTNCLPGSVKKINLKLSFLVTIFWATGLFFSTTSVAQSPANCTSGCTSNDVQIVGAYLSSDLNGTKLTSYICGSGQKVYLTLQLTTNTPRVGVSIWSQIQTVVNGVATGTVVGTVSQCFGTALNATGSTVTFPNAINWTCGSQIALVGTYTAWGTGNTNFCAGSNGVFQCGATPSKCHLAPAGSIIIIQTPPTGSASDSKCSSVSGSYSAGFDLTSYESALIGGASTANYTFSFYRDAGLTNQISSPSTYTATAASNTIYVNVCDATHPTACSVSTITLTVNPLPSVSGIGSGFTKTCTQNASGGTIGEAPVSGFSYSWSPSTGLSSASVGNPTANPAATTTYTVIKTDNTNGCTNTAQATVAVNTATPNVGVSGGGTLTCTTTSIQLTGTSTTQGAAFAWSGSSGSIAGNPINATASGTYTLVVTDLSNGCTSSASVSVSSNTSAPVAGISVSNAITCAHTSATLTGSPVSGVTYSWSGPGITQGNANSASPVVSAGGTYTLLVTNTSNGCTATASTSVSANTTAPAFTVCLVQPTLCDNTAGSVTVFATNGTTFSYKLNNGSGQASNVFSGLGGGSVSSITVTNENGCATTVSCANLQLNSSCGGAAITQKSAPINNSMTLTGTNPTVNAYPNPFNDNVKFVVNSPIAGSGSLEVYNILGQRIKTIYQGHINAGTQNFELNVSKKQQATLIYIFKVGNQKVTGKLLQLNN